jgi:hypothetical protein
MVHFSACAQIDSPLHSRLVLKLPLCILGSTHVQIAKVLRAQANEQHNHASIGFGVWSQVLFGSLDADCATFRFIGAGVWSFSSVVLFFARR